MHQPNRSGDLSGRLILRGSVLALLIGAPAAFAQDHSVPRAADGRPDLSGFYNVATLTPLVRPPEFGDKLYLTEKQAKEIEERERALLARGLEASDPGRGAPPSGGAAPVGFDEGAREILGAGNVGGYNSFWIDRGSRNFDLDGVVRTSIVTKPENGRMPAMTAEGQKRMTALFSTFRPNDGTAYWLKEKGAGPYDNHEQRPLAERCLLGFGSTSGPPMFPVLYNNLKRIVQTPEYVMILVEMNHDARIIRLDAEHDPPSVRKWLGDSVGRWEVDTLVVDTKHFRSEPGLYFASPDLHVVERFTRLDDRTLHYEFTVDDPATWTEPWTGDYPWPATDERVFEYACHEGNYALGNIMRGARLLEAEALKKEAASGGSGN